MKLFLLFILLLTLIGCGDSQPKKSSTTTQNVAPYFSSQKLVIKVFYEPEAEPYTESIHDISVWQLLETNLHAIFQGRTKPPQLVVPKSLSEMQAIPKQSKLTWSVSDVMSLASGHETVAASGEVIFSIFFLSGTAQEGANTLGYHISGTRTMAIFKDVIRMSATSGNPFLQYYVEQSTVVHEMGHALGLVNNGLPMKTNHQDAAHGAHCSNPNCVMYYSNEGLASMTQFAQKALINQSFVMFDNQCLEDARSY